MTLSAVRSSDVVAARRAAPPAPEGLAALDARAHAVIAALRCIAAGLADCPTVARLVDDGLGCPRGEGLARVFVFARILAHEARRPLAVGWPGCRALTGLERALAAALAPGGDVDDLRHVLRTRPGPVLDLAFTSLRSAPTAM